MNRKNLRFKSEICGHRARNRTASGSAADPRATETSGSPSPKTGHFNNITHIRTESSGKHEPIELNPKLLTGTLTGQSGNPPDSSPHYIVISTLLTRSSSPLSSRSRRIQREKIKTPTEWWSTYGGGCPNLSRLAMRILSQTCSLTGCKLNRIHLEQMGKAKNCLEHQRLNDLVFVQYNLRLRHMAMKNREHDVVDPISCDNIKIAENWVTENELGSEDFGSSDWMTVYLPLGNIMLLGPQIDDVDALGAGFDDYEIFGVKDSEEENGEGK